MIRVNLEDIRKHHSEKILKCKKRGMELEDIAFHVSPSSTSLYCKECSDNLYIEIPDGEEEYLWELKDEEENLWVLNVNRQSERTL